MSTTKAESFATSTAADPPLVNPEASSPARAAAPATPHRHLVQPEDFDAGFKDVPVEYRRGAPLEGFPDKIRVRMLSYLEVREIARKTLSAGGGMDSDPCAPYLQPSLSPFHASEDFLNQLTVQSLARLEFVAFVLAYDGVVAAEDDAVRRH